MQFTSNSLKSLIICLLLLSIGSVIGFQVGLRKQANPQASIARLVSLKSAAAPKDYEKVDFGQFWEVWQILENQYLDPKKLDTKKQVYGAIQGMTSSLEDPYTIYLPPTDQKRSSEDLAGAFGGVGIELGFRESTLAVISPIAGNAAEKAGIKAGDFILNIKDTKKDLDIDTNGLSLQEAVNHIRGEIGTEVTLQLAREGGEKPFDVTLKREEIVVPSVTLTYTEKDGKKAALVKLSRFGGRTDQEWGKIVSEIASQPSLTGVILDLRNNPGGYLDGAIDVGSEFIKDGKVVTQEGRYKNQEYPVNRQGKLVNVPVNVLVNKGSASASEIVAGALRDRRKAKLIGENTFGKGTVQDALELDNGAGLHVTVGRWLLPSGEWIHEKGIKPDIEVVDDEKTPDDEVVIKALESF